LSSHDSKEGLVGLAIAQPPRRVRVATTGTLAVLRGRLQSTRLRIIASLPEAR
jgi:hypothetical protein